MPRCGTRAPTTCSSTSTRRTGSRWTGGACGGSSSRTGRASRSGRRSSCSRGSFASDARLDAGRVHPCHPQDRVPGAALPVHLANRAVGGPRPAPAAGVDDPASAPGRGPAPAAPGGGARPAGRRCQPGPRRGRRLPARLGAAQRRPRPRQRHRDRVGRIRVQPARALRAAPGRRLRRGRRLDQRDVRQRRSPDTRAPACARRRDPHRRDRPALRAMSLGRSFGETNPGRKRRRNEDAFVCEPPLFAVADGMGGAQAGEIASSLAAAAVAGGLNGADAPENAEQLVVELIQEANRRGHVGDSRAYLLRDGALEQLTDDHSLVAELVRRGELSPEEAEVHPQRSVITRALGTDPDVDVDAFSLRTQAGDLFLLCSDGLSTMVDGETIAALLTRHRHDLHAAARALIKEANDRGGDDNITAVLFEVAEGDPDEETRERATAGGDDEDTLHPEAEADAGPPPAPAHGHEGDTIVVPAGELRPSAGEPGDERRATPLQHLAAALVTAALVALIVVLVTRGLAR